MSDSIPPAVDESRAGPSTSELLAYEASLRSLARRLVSDDADAEDLIQETFLEALRRPPRGVERLQAWLGVVLRRKWTRTLQKRRARAQIRTRAAESHLRLLAEDLDADVERRDLRIELERLIATLPESSRVAIQLRYFEGLSFADIALRLDSEESTVRTWVHRGLEKLRLRLDEAHGGDRRRWIGALVVGFGLRDGRAFGWRAKLASAVGVVAAGSLVYLGVSGGGAGRVRGEVPEMPRVASEGIAGASPPEVSSRAAVGGFSSVESIEASSPVPATRSFELRLLDDGEPVSGAALRVAASHELDEGQVWAYTDDEGRARLEGLPIDGWVRPEWENAIWHGLHLSSVDQDESLVIEARSFGHVEGVVRDANQHAVADAQVRVTGTEGFQDPYLDEQGRLWMSAAIDEVRTDAEGRYRLRKPIDHWMRIVAIAPDGDCNLKTVATMISDSTSQVDLELLPSAIATGRVVDASERPVAGARVALRAPALFPERETTSDAEGRFRLTRLPGGRQTLVIEHGALGLRRSERLPAGRTVELGDCVLEEFAPNAETIELPDVQLIEQMPRGSLRVRRAHREPRVARKDFAPGTLLLHGRWLRTSRPFGAGSQEDLVFEDLPPGEYVLRLECPPFEHVQETVHIRDNEHVDFDLELRRGAPQWIRMTWPRPLELDEDLELVLSSSRWSGSILLPLERRAAVRPDHLLRRLAPDLYRLEARTSGGLVGALDFQVEGFAPAERTIELR